MEDRPEEDLLAVVVDREDVDEVDTSSTDRERPRLSVCINIVNRRREDVLEGTYGLKLISLTSRKGKCAKLGRLGEED